MRFLIRSLGGIALAAITAGLLIVAGANLMRALAPGDEEGARGGGQEREYTVSIAAIEPVSAVPVIAAYGEIVSARTLELRAPAAGRLVRLAEGFRDGAEVATGDLLFEVDPAEAASGVALAEAAAREAGAEQADAAAALDFARDALATAMTQRDLRAQAVARQRDLNQRGAGTTASTEDAELALSSAEQAVLSARQRESEAEARIARAAIAADRAALNLADARRALADTRLAAPFPGLVANAAALEGRLVSAGEKLGDLIDTSRLDVAFRLTNAQHARLEGPEGGIAGRPVRLSLMLDDIPVEAGAVIERVAAEVGAGRTGRLVYARLEDAGGFRPGDFVTVSVDEAPLDNVAVLPAAAMTGDGRILLVTDDNRLEEVQVTLLRRQGDSVIVDGAPAGRDYVTQRSRQLGPGLKVRPVRQGAGFEAVSASVIELDDDRRARLIAFVEASDRMPAETKARLLAQLADPQVPRAMVERLEARMGG
jgi:multidrug efflux pump subunit AcrA (membrane-fusion protein)